MKLIHRLLLGRSLFKDKRFQETEESLNLIGQHLLLERFDTNQNIIEYGVRGEKFYMILKGSASVWIPNPNASKDGSEDQSMLED